MYGEGKWAGDLVHFLVGHTKSPLVLVPWHIFLCGFAARTTNDPHGTLSSSTTPLSSSLFTSFHITLDSWAPYLGGLKQIGEWIPVSICNENPQIGWQKPSSQNTSQYYETTSLILYCKSLGQPCIFKFFSKSFVLVCTSRSMASSLNIRGSFACFNNLPQSLNTHSMPSLSVTCTSHVTIMG